MKRFIATMLTLIVVIGSSIPAYAAITGGGESTSTSDREDQTQSAKAPGCAVLGTGSAVEYTGSTPYPDEESMRAGMGDSAKPSTHEKPVTDKNSPFYLDVTKDPGPQADRLKDLLKNDPEKYIDEYSKVSGIPKDQIYDDLKAGRNPMVTVKPTADVRYPDGTIGRGVDTYDVIAKAFGISKKEAMEATKGGKSITQTLNDLLVQYPEAAKGFGTSTNSSKNDGYGFLFGYMTGGAWVNDPPTLKFIEYDGQSLANFAEHFGRGSEMYFNLLAALGLAPPDPEGPPKPEIPPPSASLEWKSKPHAFGEIKHDSYSVGRNSEEWEAMAGIPHDETLYYDAGASNLSAQFRAKAPVSQRVPSPPGSLVGPCDHEMITISCCSGHSFSACKWCGGSSCGQEDECSDEDGDTYSCCSGDDCSHTPIGHPNHSISLTWDYPSSMENYYPIESYDVLESKKVQETLSYIEDGSVNLDATQMAQIVEHLENQGKWGSWASATVASSLCKEHRTKSFESLANEWLTRYKESPLLTFTTDYLTLKDRDGKTYKVWQKYDINIYISGWSGQVICGGSLKISLKAGNSPSDALAVSRGEAMDYITKWTSKHGWKKSNFLPAEQSWDKDTKFEVCGYNGEWKSKKRRDCTTHPHLFYKDNLTFTDRIVNGEKTSGPGEVTYIEVPVGKFGVTSIAERAAKTEYERGYGHVNNVVVHSPVAIEKYYISRDHYPADQRTSAYDGSVNDMYITPSLNFHVNRTIEWSKGVQISDRGIKDVTEKKGNGYYLGLDTERWVEEVYYRFPFEVIYLGDNKRYSKDTWISIPVDEYKSEFTLPVSEDEVPNAQYDAIVIAKNSPFRGQPQQAWDEEAERYLNYERACGCQGDLEASHGAKNFNTVDILGRIGNFTIDYSPDPNWSAFFSQKAIPEKWLVQNLVPEVNAKQFNKFLGPHHDIFDRMWWRVQDVSGRGVATDRWPHGLDSYTSIPHYSKGHIGGILPAAPGKNLESVQDLLQFEPIKMGYPVWWSIETLGNYGTSVARLQVHPKFYLFDTKAATPGSQPVDVYAKVGSSYKRIHDNANRKESDYKLNYSTKLTHDERRLGQVEKDLTKLVVGNGEYGDMFNPANVRWLGTPNEMILTKTLRTFFGTQTFEGDNHQPNTTSNGTPLAHAEQAQRWHGTLLVPSSAKFTKPGEKDFIDTEGKYLMVVLEFTTLDANPWNIKTEGSLSVGSNMEKYFPWFEYKTPDQDKDVPPTHTINIPPDTVVVFDPNNPSLQDVQIHGTY